MYIVIFHILVIVTRMGITSSNESKWESYIFLGRGCCKRVHSDWTIQRQVGDEHVKKFSCRNRRTFHRFAGNFFVSHFDCVEENAFEDHGRITAKTFWFFFDF